MGSCGKLVKPAKNGKNRGVCCLFAGHRGNHGSVTCASCGIALTSQTATQSRLLRGSGKCRKCSLEYSREWGGHKPQNRSEPGKYHIFQPCGCSGILPEKGHSNQFAISSPSSQKFRCRAGSILAGSIVQAKKNGYVAISRNTTHQDIRILMKNPNCAICGESLEWIFAAGKTPPLHHNHETGQPLGFSHIGCNVGAESLEIARLNHLVHALTIENLKLQALLQK